MKKINEEIITQILEYAVQHPETPYHQIATTFDLSEITVKRYCAGLKRSKKWRAGRTSGSADPQRFWAKVAKGQPNECWLWSGCRNGDGYGFLHWNSHNTGAHRLAFSLSKGEIPEGFEVDHACRNRACCNPEHLTAVSHSLNMEKAGFISRTASPIDTPPPQQIDTPLVIDPASSETLTCDHDQSLPFLKDSNISVSALDPLDTAPATAAVSIKQDQPSAMPPEKKRRTSSRPPKADPFAPICVMQEPPEIDIPQHPLRTEAASGSKADLQIADWADAEFGPYWWSQTDEQLRAQTVFQQTESMRENGEFLHWYFVTPTDPSHKRTGMSARTGPEACVKVERSFGKGWAASWEYVKPDPHRGPFFDYQIVLIDGDRAMTVARTVTDAIAMVESVWAPGVVLECSRMSRPTPEHLKAWSLHWREFLTEQRKKLEERRRAA